VARRQIGMEKAGIALVSIGKAGSDPAKVLYASVIVTPVGITVRQKTTSAGALTATIVAGEVVCLQPQSIQVSSRVLPAGAGRRRPGTPVGGQPAVGDERKATKNLVCPKCGAEEGKHGKGGHEECLHPSRRHYRGEEDGVCRGLLCECDGRTGKDHGQTKDDICENARCYHCGWGGRVPSKRV
jgi:hypothetical protein